MEDADEEEEEYADFFAPRRLHPLDFVIALLAFLNLVFQAAGTVTDFLADRVAGHESYLQKQRDFEDEVRVELESLPTKE